MYIKEKIPEISYLKWIHFWRYNIRVKPA